ncbi:dihydrolipoyl dehydrogenase [Candidatus Borrarchaeum sp.]|uniref:dihydrolipoyl dehydrogenase n=1 Tax=Candidatus Borrarchaeum sp. TaxID=2846742 RepID=UPI00257DC307|nr:dihydrolipoyl dehydrogenase [Candidatus Borrarchaeum sp.]
MDNFDVMVIGAGSGEIILDYALSHGMKVALIERGPLGGTCANRGCIPSKILLYPADVVDTIKNAGKFGINAKIVSIDFKYIMNRMRGILAEDQKREQYVERVPNLKWYKGIGEFVSDYTLKVNGTKIKADAVFIVSGARPYIPPIEGLDNIDYLTSATLLELEELPKSFVVVGGGYIACEYAHFLSSMGSKVTIVQRATRLVKEQEPEISELLKSEMGKKMDIFTGYEVKSVSEIQGGLKEVIAEENDTGKETRLSAEAILIAAGRRSNSDLLKLEKTGVEIGAKGGWVKVNEYFETSKERIWAFGDAIGPKHYMFKHVANYEARVTWYNAHSTLHPEEVHRHDHGDHATKVAADYHAVPWAVFSNPEIAGVGLTERQAREQLGEGKLLIAKNNYKDTAKGEAMGNPPGFLKLIVERETQKILGAHIIGVHASILIQEITNIMNCGDGTILPLYQAMHIHPALTEVVSFALGNFQEA